MKNGPYELVIAPNNYDLKKYRGRYCYEHHLVWFENKSTIPKGYVIHHKNGNHRDNNIENLELLTIKDHKQWHYNNGGKEKLLSRFKIAE